MCFGRNSRAFQALRRGRSRASTTGKPLLLSLPISLRGSGSSGQEARGGSAVSWSRLSRLFSQPYCPEISPSSRSTVGFGRTDPSHHWFWPQAEGAAISGLALLHLPVFLFLVQLESASLLQVLSFLD